MFSVSVVSRRLFVALVTLLLLGLIATGAGTLAQDGPPPPNATPGEVGVSAPLLGAVEEPAAAPGHRMIMSEIVFAPGSYVTRHIHPAAASIICVVSGAWGITIHSGTATVTRAGTGGAPESTEPVELDSEVILEPSDCISTDGMATRTQHTVWNASDEQTILWVVDLYDPNEPFTIFVNEAGTPVAAP